jgi:hypothetical protein
LDKKECAEIQHPSFDLNTLSPSYFHAGADRIVIVFAGKTNKNKTIFRSQLLNHLYEFLH